MSRMRFAVAAVVFVAVTIATGLIAIAAMPLRAASIASTATPNEPLPLLVSRFLIAEGPATAVSWTAAAQPQAAESKAVEEMRAAEGKLWAQTVPDAPRRQINKTYPEYPQDALERGIRGTVLVDITVNAAGDVTTAAVASGPQELHASAFKAAVGLKYTPGPSTIAIRISVEYMLTGTSWGVRIGDAAGSGGTRVMMTSTDRYAPAPIGALRVGGDVRPPKKLKDVPPEYPPLVQESRVQGVVIMEVRIDERGTVTDVRPLRSIPLLDQAAINAVKQWQYEPTLMNGVAVPVIMTVTVNFTLRDVIQMQVVLPDGNTLALDMFSGALVDGEFSGTGAFQLRASRERASNDVTVSVFTDGGQTHLGDVVLTLGGPVVQSPTMPSFGMRLLGVR